MTLPPGGSVKNLSASVAGDPARERLAQVIEAANASRRSDGAEGVGVAVRVCKECLLAATRFEVVAERPNGTKVLGSTVAYATTARECQSRCLEETQCDYFNFRRQDRQCTLLTGPAAPVRDADSVAGPRECSLPPPALVIIPGAVVKLQDDADDGGVWGLLGHAAGNLVRGDLPTLVILCGLLSLLLGSCLVAGVIHGGGGRRQRRRRGKRMEDGHKYAPLSRGDIDNPDEEDHSESESSAQEDPFARKHRHAAAQNPGLPPPIPQEAPEDLYAPHPTSWAA